MILLLLLGACLALMNSAFYLAIDRLPLSLAAAFVFVMPIGFSEAIAALPHPALILAGIGVGVSSSVVPYICDQFAMSRLSRNTFALLLALLPATATIIGAIVLGQIPTLKDIVGILLVMIGVAIHKPAT